MDFISFAMIQQSLIQTSTVDAGMLGRSVTKIVKDDAQEIQLRVSRPHTHRALFGRNLWNEYLKRNLLNEPYCFLLCKYESSFLLH